MDVADVDYVAFESKLSHIPAQPGKVNCVYVQVHNRGIKASSSVVVKLLFADLSLGLPDLPADFWIKFPNNSVDVTKWKPIGAPKTIASLSNTEPTVLEWDWVPPLGVSPGGCLLVIVDCPSNPIPPANKLFAVSKLVWIEKRVGMRNILIIEQAPEGPHFLVLNLYPSTRKPQTIKVFPSDTGVGGLAFVLPKIAFSDAKSKTGRAKKARASASKLESGLQGVAVKKLPATLHKKIEEARGNQIEGFDMTSQYVIADITKGGKIAGIKVPRGGLQVIALATGPAKVNETATLSISQEEGEEIVGGITIILRATKE